MRLLASAIEFVLELSDHPIFILVVALQLLDLILHHQYDARSIAPLLRLQRLAMTLNLDILLLRRGLLMMVKMTLTFLMFLLALRARARGLFVSADLINHNYYKNLTLIIINEHPTSHTNQTGRRYPSCHLV